MKAKVCEMKLPDINIGFLVCFLLEQKNSYPVKARIILGKQSEEKSRREIEY